MKALMLFPMGLAAMLTGAPQASTHSGRVEGAVQATLAGQAVFGPIRGADNASFSLELGAYSDNGAVVFSRVSGERPRAGTYKVVAFAPGEERPGEFHAMVTLGSVAAPLGAFRAVSGTVTILQSSADKIVGRYEVKAVGFMASDPENEGREITVRGGFSAEPAGAASSFEATTHGAVDVAPRGSAEFGMADDGQSPRFTLSLGAYSEQGAIVLSRMGSGRPAVGVYPVSAARSERSGDFSGLVVTGSPSQPTGVFHAEGGSVTITSSTADRISGTFELHGTGFLAASPDDEAREIVVSGSFSAAAHPITQTMSLR